MRLWHSPLFDPVYYGVLAGETLSREAAIRHYMANFREADLSPHPLFDTLYYLAQNPPIDRDAEPPLANYLRVGDRFSLDPHLLFSTSWYRRRFLVRDTLPENSLEHYLLGFTAPDGGRADPHPLFDEEFVAAQRTVSGKAASPALLDYVCGELPWDLSTSPWFDAPYFVKQLGLNWSLEGITLLAYLLVGSTPTRAHKPNPLFDPDYFRKHNPDCPLSLCPLVHFADPVKNRGKLVSPKLTRLAERAGSDPARIVLVLAPEPAQPNGVADRIPEQIRALQADAVGRGIGLSGILPRAIRDRLPAGLGERFGESEALSIRSLSDVAPAATALQALSLPHGRNLLCSNIAIPSRAFLLLPPETLFREGLDVSASCWTEAPATLRRAAGSTPTILIPVLDWQTSGVNTWVECVADALTRRGYKVRLVLTGNPYAYPSALNLPMAHVTDLRLTRTKPSIWKQHLRAYFTGQAPCVVLTAYDHENNRLASEIGDGVRVIGVLHSDDPVYYEEVAHCGKNWDAIVAVSGHIADTVKSALPHLADRVTCIPYGIEPPDGFAQPPCSGEPLRITYTGRVVQEQKRAFDFPLLADALEREGIPFVFNILGDGPDWEALRELLEPHIARGRVRMPGRMAPAEIARELRASHVFVLLSDYEGLPLSLLEAIGHGLVPVVTEIPSGIPEVVRHMETGLLFRPGDCSEAAALLAGLWRKPDLWERLSANALGLFRQRFTADAMADAYQLLIDKNP